MFKYVNDLSNIAHHIIEIYVTKKGVAIDATLGNGYDTDFLSERFNKVYAYDIQNIAIESYRVKCKSNVILINDSHDKFKESITEEVDCIMYNLGFLPGGDKSITTISSTTIASIKDGLDILVSGGIITIGIYIGHCQGENEGNDVLEFLQRLSKDKYGVMLHKFINRSEKAPMLAVIEKK